ncbi:MAG: hypothetical protein PWQ77_1443 [Kosmotogales bacterium]|nr:hypothetical protein [Kosmotogales bacterium]
MFIASKNKGIMLNLERFEEIKLNDEKNTLEFINASSGKANPKIVFPTLEKARECFTAISMRMGDSECMMIDSYLKKD